MQQCHLEFAFINISRNLELALNRPKSVSSHLKLKEDVLSSLKQLINQAPLVEYQKLLDVKEREIVIGYLLSCLTRLAKDDKSRSIRMKSLSIISALTNKLVDLHEYSIQKCSISIVRNFVPGLCSSLFKILMGDTKLPKDLFVIALELLASLISAIYKHCEHDDSKEDKTTELDQIGENLGVRLAFLIDYVINHNSELGQSVLFSTMDLIQTIVEKPRLLKHDLNCIIRFIAFMSSQMDVYPAIEKLRTTIDKNEDLDSVISLGLVKQIEELDQDLTTLLPSERESQITLLAGYTYMMPTKSLTALLELDNVRSKLVDLLVNLTEFSNQQSFLFLTDILIGEDALETNINRVCKSEKRFEHNLTKKELDDIEHLTLHLGQSLEWNCLVDLLIQILNGFSCPSKMLIHQMILKGLINRDSSPDIAKYLKQILQQIIQFVEDANIKIDSGCSDITNLDILKVIVTLETIVMIIELILRFSTKAETCRALHATLCPLLICASSSSRSISETSLSSLALISHYYGHKSIKELIESNTDYVVDGISRMLDQYGVNDQIANVFAITFKLSSMETFYYFKDTYERIFKLIGQYHWHILRTRSIALLFARTVEILNDWRWATNEKNVSQSDDLSVVFDTKKILHDIDIVSRVEKLKLASKSQKFDNLTKTVDENQLLNDIRSGKHLDDAKLDDQANETEKQPEDSGSKAKPIDVIITERILVHSINLVSANDAKTKILALKCISIGFKILSQDEDVLLPLVHKAWTPLLKRLTGDYSTHLDVNLAGFECLMSMARFARDFIKHRTLDTILPRICLFLEAQANHSLHKKEYGPYCTNMAYKCQEIILKNLGPLAYNIELGYKHLWRIIEVALVYLNPIQVPALYEAARESLMYLMVADCDCVWYFARKANKLSYLPFNSIYDDEDVNDKFANKPHAKDSYGKPENLSV